MKRAPNISVIMSVYSRNRGDGICSNLLKRALDSILNQTFRDFELILIDDASKDGSADVCKEYAARDQRIKYLRFEQNSGLPAIRYNDGIAISTGKYLTFMFDDDEWYPNALGALYEGITNQYPECGLVYGLVDYIDGKTYEVTWPNLGEKWSKTRIKYTNFLSNNAVIIKREVIDTLGGYDENPVIKRLCDWDLWDRLSNMYPVGRIPVQIGRVYSDYHDSIGSMSMDRDAIKQHQRNRGNVFRLQKNSQTTLGKWRCGIRKIYTTIFCMLCCGDTQDRVWLRFMKRAINYTKKKLNY